MFYEGDLQSGIALAIKDSKTVVCFVHDDTPESAQYEDEYLQDPQIARALSMSAVTLKIKAGSQESNFLAAYHHIQTVPMAIMIRPGQPSVELLPNMSPGVLKTQILQNLVNRPEQATNSSTAGTSQGTPVPPTASSSEHTPSDLRDNRQSSDATSSQAEPSVSSTPADPSPESTSQANEQASAVGTSSQGSQAVQRLLQDRKRRLEEEDRAKKEAEKAERKAKADAHKATELKNADPAKAKQLSHAQEQRRRQHEAKLERERILRQIEQDKADRREKEERRKALAKAEAAAESQPSGDQNADRHTNNERNQASQESFINAVEAGKCSVQVRLFDGNSVRNRFDIGQTLKDVRDWVDKQSSFDRPYTFKHILSPLPNKTLTISEEQDSLRDLGFIPSATLVMVPISMFSDAYSDNDAGIVSRGLSAGYNTLSAGAGLVSGAVGTFLGFGRVAAPTEAPRERAETESPPPAAESSKRQNIHVRTLHDQREPKDDHQLYNGNQLNFQPRRDETNKED